MDCYSVESEFMESLDFLSPPVKRLQSSREAFGSTYYNEPNNVHLLRGLRSKFARRVPSSLLHQNTVNANPESSTSLILKKTSERQQILEHYSIVSYTSLRSEVETPSDHRPEKSSITTEKPLIRVTVIPKTDQGQTAKILRKRRYIPKRVQSTTSNQENSVQTKNVYLIVAGRRKEKIYEIKTTGSAKLSSDHDSHAKDDDIPIKEISNFKHLIRSLNMDRKKKKERKKPLDNFDTPQQTSVEWKAYPECENCMSNKESVEDPEAPKKSRLKIFGQFGISEDDKYVLRYGASINDKEVLSDVAQLTRDFSPVIVPLTKYGTSYDDPERQKDSCTQANCDNEVYLEQNPTKDSVPRQESQGTQVNFNVQISSTMKEKPSRFSDKKIQCSCYAVTNKSDNKVLKDCQSPLVIISVYPKQSPEEMETSIQSASDNIRSSSPNRINTYNSSHLMKVDRSPKRSNIETRRNNKTISRSRSPSPAKKSSKAKMSDDKHLESSSNKIPVAEKRSPDRQKALRAIKEKIQEKDNKLKQDASNRKSRMNATHSTPVSKNMQNTSVSNATQVSNKNQHHSNITSNATQVSPRIRQSFNVSNATQCNVKSPQNAPAKHGQNAMSPNKQSFASNATQASRGPKRFVASNATQISKNEYFTASNGTQVSKTPQHLNTVRISNKNQETFTVPTATQVFKNEQTSKIMSPSHERGTNTDHAKAKKALVESYTKKLTEQMDQKEYNIPSRYDSSKITINIDGDKEYYDVLYNQDKISTDLTVRKTLKHVSSQKGYDEECKSASLENLLRMPDSVIQRSSLLPGHKSPTKSMSIALYNNRSDDESPLTKHCSRISIRDSIEISHRREDKSIHNNIKNTQTCFTAQCAETVPDETEFLAPIKHYTGDDCSICDPIERDKQIRVLLGVEKNISSSKTRQAHNIANDEFPYECIYRQECKKSQVTEINYQFQKMCPCFKRKAKGKPVQCASVQCQRTTYTRTKYNTNNNFDFEEQYHVNKAYDAKVKSSVSPLRITNDGRPFTNTRFNREQYNNDDNGCTSKACENYSVNTNAVIDENINDNGNEADDDNDTYDKEKSAIYQQLILNRNVQVFLQVDQFSKQKPIVLSRQQYNKVKKTIQKTICCKNSNHDKRKKYVCNKCERSEVTVGEVRTKITKETNTLIDKEAQTDLVPCDNEICKKERKKAAARGRHNKNNVHRLISAELSEDLSEDREKDQSHTKERQGKRPKSRNWKKGRTGGTKRVADQKIGVAVADGSNISSQKGSKHRLCDGKHERNEDRHNKRTTETKTNSHAEQNATPRDKHCEEKKMTCGPEKCKEHKREHGTETKRDRTPGRYCERGRDVDGNEQCFKPKEVKKIDYLKDLDIERNETEVETTILYNAENARNSTNYQTEMDSQFRKTMSSVEIRYASIAYLKQMAYSSTDVGALSDSSLAHVNSFHTIFRGHRKSHTPNLGTSAYSLYSEDGLNSEHKSAKFIMEPRDSKPKKPFLRRLMSCLVMRSTRESELKLPPCPAPDIPSVNSSIDSYHISTSFGAVEVSSSIYDTSASFYSNHTILPVNSKIKRGFFSSVRGFLTNRKS